MNPADEMAAKPDAAGSAEKSDQQLRAIYDHLVAIENAIFHADWGQFGSGAGPIRNSKMLAEGKPEMVLAFPGGRGTANIVEQARSAGVSVCEVSRTADW